MNEGLHESSEYVVRVSTSKSDEGPHHTHEKMVVVICMMNALNESGFCELQ
jgi:hypothetical protein